MAQQSDDEFFFANNIFNGTKASENNIITSKNFIIGHLSTSKTAIDGTLDENDTILYEMGWKNENQNLYDGLMQQSKTSLSAKPKVVSPSNIKQRTVLYKGKRDTKKTQLSVESTADHQHLSKMCTWNRRKYTRLNLKTIQWVLPILIGFSFIAHCILLNEKNAGYVNASKIAMSLNNFVPNGLSEISGSNKKKSSHLVKDEENNTLIPPWMVDYFQWHAKVLENLNEENWQIGKNYLVMQCLETDEKCGGLSDRLRPLPFMVLMAARSKRLLFIQWIKPFPLEEFLVPPVGGLNWTIPAWLAPNLKTSGPRIGSLDSIVTKTLRKNLMVIRTLYQSNNYGSYYFNNQNDTKVSFEDVYHEMFSYLFTPTPPIADIIRKFLEDSNLIEGNYSAAHFRVLHGRKTRPQDETRRVAINAINCASELRPGGPVFFASDNKYAVDIIDDYSKKMNLPVFFLQHAEEPLHLDKAANWTHRSPSEYYATFVDLLILGSSRCLAYNSGGFGTFGLLLGFNSSCSVRYFSKRIIKSCPKWITKNA